MTYEVFEGQKSVKVSRLKQDTEAFEKMLKDLGLSEHMDLVTFCASLSMIMKSKDKNYELIAPTGTKKIAGMDAFNKRNFYDLLISEYFEIDKNKMTEFEKHYYSGFILLKQWFQEEGLDSLNELDRFSRLIDYMEVNSIVK